MKQLKLAVTGVGGRMGSMIVRQANAAGFKVVGATERPSNEAVGEELGHFLGQTSPNVQIVDALDKAIIEGKPDVVIDFTSADASVLNAGICAKKKVPMIIGSTGFDNDRKAKVSALARVIPIVLSPNMSVGVNLVIEIAALLARRLGNGFDIDVLEAHHRLKKDAPSGTALRLAEEIAKATGRSEDDLRLERVGQLGERRPNEIGVQTLRGGDVVGEHTVFFFGDGERIELSHRATSREQFARGALRAARWVVDKTPGLYAMSDVLKE
jgi:4-hydroxy-tetrahydrodipicolinate reductase